MTIPISKVQAAAMAYFRLEAELCAPPSPSGGQLEALRLQMGSDADAQAHNRSRMAEGRALRFAAACQLLRDLTPRELEICRLRYWWIEHEAREAYARAVPMGELLPRRDEEEPWIPATLATRQGEPLLAPVRDAEGEPVASRAIVAASRVRFTAYETIATALSLTARQVRRTLGGAHNKIARRIAIAEGAAQLSDTTMAEDNAHAHATH